MSRSGAWSFATLTGRAEVAPDEVRVRRRVRTIVANGAKAVRSGRFGALADAFGWTGVGAALTVLSAAPRLLSAGGGDETVWLTGLAALTVTATLAASVARGRRVVVPLRTVDRVEFNDDTLVVVHEEVDDGRFGGWVGGDDSGGSTDRTETEIRPLDDAARADAALALRLRGVDCRGLEDDDAVSRTVVDAPKTELVN